MGLGDRLSHAWNAFRRSPDKMDYTPEFGMQTFGNPSVYYRPVAGDQTIVTSIYNQIAIDVSNVPIRHVSVDENGNLKNYRRSDLDECLHLSANIDQTGQGFFQDLVLTLFEEGAVAIVPVDTDVSPDMTAGWDVRSMRVGQILQWFPKHVRVEVYNDTNGQREQLTLPKDFVAVVNNPLYSVMNAPNSTLQRLTQKLHLLDAIDRQSGSGKLDIIIQLPYVVKTELKKQQAEARRKAIEDQLAGSQYGIAYTDGAERITQLNRPSENNLMGQIQWLTTQLYNQLGMTEDVFNGKADARQMLNYQNRTVRPVLKAITDALTRTFLTKTARTQNQRVMAIEDPFLNVPLEEMSSLVDSVKRNEIGTANELRPKFGWPQADDEAANQLVNSNINPAGEQEAPGETPDEGPPAADTPISELIESSQNGT